MQGGMSRRAFVRRCAIGLAAPAVVARAALGGPGKTAPSDRIGTGHIGVGGMGSGHLRSMVGRADVSVVAVCEVDEKRGERAYQVAGQRATVYRDYRHLLENRDVDAVVIATPDHWHALMTRDACQAGKDVYCEKPLSVAIRDGRAVVEAARRYARVVQLGTQWRSYHTGRLWAQYARNGHCGRIREVRCWHPPNPRRPAGGDREPPPTIDWDLWLGPMAWRPYNPAICPANFRWLMESGGGNIRDRGVHILGMISWALGIDHVGPVAVQATGTRHDGLYDVPTTMSATWEFADPAWTLRWEQPGQPMGASFGAIVIGDRDTLVFRRPDRIAQPPKVMREALPGEIELERSTDHRGNFLAAVRTRRRPIMDVAIGHSVTTLCNLGNVAFALGRRLRWDPAREEFPDDPEANRLLSTPYREPWTL